MVFGTYHLLSLGPRTLEGRLAKSVEVLGLEFWILGFRIWGSGFRIEGFGYWT